jgi:collagenase-like PrtC family protease
MAVLINPLVLPLPLDQIGDQVLDELDRLREEYGVGAATLGDARLAELVRQRLPGLQLTASCLLEVTEPGQAQALRGVFDTLVPSTRLTRRPDRLAPLRAAFGGRLRLLVNEGCLDSCLERKQHFYEMAHGGDFPQSLCRERLARDPWLRLTGAWILPQHLSQLDACADEFKLAGRVTLRDPDHYRRVLRAYVERRALWPHEIGGGPATVSARTSVSRAHFRWMLECDHGCGDCAVCRRAAAGQWTEEAVA